MIDLTPADITRRLSQISKEIEKTTKELEEADEAAIHARGAYKLAYNKALISAEGAADIRKATAEISCYELWLAAEVADKYHRDVVQRLRALRDSLEVGRSLGAIMRLEWGSA